ncbi:hypothetical protein MRX96_033833 [Rhipicephalus microplus]
MAFTDGAHVYLQSGLRSDHFEGRERLIVRPREGGRPEMRTFSDNPCCDRHGTEKRFTAQLCGSAANSSRAQSSIDVDGVKDVEVKAGLHQRCQIGKQRARRIDDNVYFL